MTTVAVRPAATLGRHALLLGAVVILAIAIALPAYIRLSDPVHIVSDIPLHAALARDTVLNRGWISYSLWYPLLFITTGGASDPAAMQVSAVVFLTLATVARAVVAYVLVARETARPVVAALGAVVILLAMPIVNPLDPTDIYLGQLTANVWHNSTTILVAPFALAAFGAGVSLLRSPRVGRAIVFSVTIVLVVLMKPSYALAFLPVFGIVLLVQLWRTRTKLRWAFAIVGVGFIPVVVLLAVQYGLVFHSYQPDTVRKTYISPAPFAVWRAYSDNIPISILVSLLGPVVVFAILPRLQRIAIDVVLAWSTFLVALLQLIVLAERESDRSIDLDGNFFWGAYTALLVVFLVSVVALARAFPSWPQQRGRQVALVIAIVVLAAHVATGLVYALFAGTPGLPVS